MITALDNHMFAALHTVRTAASVLGLPQTIVTSGQDGKHMVGSLHPKGKAVDFRGNNISILRGNQWQNLVQKSLGRDYHVIYETFADRSNNHLHVEYDPKPRKRK
jgi:conjugal transfer mating pair stabilization protein TraG